MLCLSWVSNAFFSQIVQEETVSGHTATPSPRRSRGRPREETLGSPPSPPSPQPPPSPPPRASPAKGHVALAAAGRLSRAGPASAPSPPPGVSSLAQPTPLRGDGGWGIDLGALPRSGGWWGWCWQRWPAAQAWWRRVSRPLGIVEVPAAACAQPGGGGGRARELDSFEQIWVKTCFRLLPRPAVAALSASFPS